MTVYFGFAVSDSMFDGNCRIERTVLNPMTAKDCVSPDVKICCNKYHAATIVAAKKRYGIEVEIPETPPKISLSPGDTLIVMTVRGLPRLTESRHYSAKEIDGADFTFAKWRIIWK